MNDANFLTNPPDTPHEEIEAAIVSLWQNRMTTEIGKKTQVDFATYSIDLHLTEDNHFAFVVTGTPSRADSLFIAATMKRVMNDTP